jgi:HSP20 family protein
MTLVKFNKRNRLFPLSTSVLNIFNKDSFFEEDIFSDDFFSENSLMPAMNVKDNENNYEIELAVPGFSKDDFEISLEDGVLHVNGQKKEEKEESDEGYTRKEFSYNSFRRSLKLPNSINQNEEMKATYKEGILKLNLNKKKDNGVESKKIIKIK